MPDLDLSHVLETIPSVSQRQIVERIVAVLEADPRVAAIWLGGSLARGNADAFSDVDIAILIDDADVPSFIAQLDRVVDRIGPTVYRRQMRLGENTILVAITPEWLRFDLGIHATSEIETRSFRHVALLFDRRGFGERLRRAESTEAIPAERFTFIVQEFLRVLGLLPVVIGREEYLVGMEGVVLLRRYLTDFFIAANGIVDRGGALRLNPLLQPEQRSMLAELPPIAPTRDAVIAGHLACAKRFLPLARELSVERGFAYPDDLARAMIEHLHRSLGVQVWT